MASGVYTWSKTASSNATADTSVNYAEGQAPSSLNDSCRALMASVAKWRDDNTGSLATGGTSTAYTATTNQSFSTLAAMSGQSLRLTMSATNGAAPTLNVDGLGAKAIVTANGTAVDTGVLVSGRVYGFVYDNANSIWIVSGGPNAFPTGTLMLFQQTAAPTGWTKQTTHNDKAIRVVSGTASSGGSTAFTSIFASRTILKANLPSYNLTVTDSGHSHALEINSNTGVASGGGAITPSTSSPFTQGAGTSIGSTDPATTGIVVASGGSGTALDFAVQYVDLIIAAKD